MFEKGAEFWVRFGIVSRFKQWYEEVVKKLLKVVHQAVSTVDVTKNRPKVFNNKAVVDVCIRLFAVFVCFLTMNSMHSKMRQLLLCTKIKS